MCDIVNGTCFGCEFGWTGDTCKQGNAPFKNFFFIIIKIIKNCPNWKKKWNAFDSFLYFTTECPDGRYGLGCNERCTGYCKHNQSCNHVTGLCDLGCANGFIGAQCNKGNEQCLKKKKKKLQSCDNF